MAFQNTTMVARTVAKWTVTVKSRKPSASTPISSLKIIRCPELDTGRNSVRPWTIPRRIACHQSIAYSSFFGRRMMATTSTTIPATMTIGAATRRRKSNIA